MNLYKNITSRILILMISISASAASTLPTDISDLVESSAPAVVNITSKKEVRMRNMPRGLDEWERFFGIPRGLPSPQQPKASEAVVYGSGFIFKECSKSLSAFS